MNQIFELHSVDIIELIGRDHLHARFELMVTLFIESYESAPSEVVLDVDATDDPLHGNQL
jgi:hypothetical protein